jgi:demethoxyubiquinone hydroxylase (CLK1/Coq7/Cat5 family)
VHKLFTGGNCFSIKINRLKKSLQKAASEEIDHLAWCEERIDELKWKN